MNSEYQVVIKVVVEHMTVSAMGASTDEVQMYMHKLFANGQLCAQQASFSIEPLDVIKTAARAIYLALGESMCNPIYTGFTARYL